MKPTWSCTVAKLAASRCFGSGGAFAGQDLSRGDQAEASPAFCCSITARASCTFHGRERHHPGGSPGSGSTFVSSPCVASVHVSGT